MNTCFKVINQNHIEVGPYLHRSLNFLSQTTINSASPLIPFVSRLVVQLEHPIFSHPSVGSASTNSMSLKVRHGLPGGSEIKNPPAMQETQEKGIWSLGWEDLLEKGMTTYSSILAWKILRTEEPGRLHRATKSQHMTEATQHEQKWDQTLETLMKIKRKTGNR